MLGMAQKLFRAQMGAQDLHPIKPCKTALHSWPFLEYLIEFYELNAIDLQMAITLLKNHSLQLESVAAFICHLSNASRNGHLMVMVEKAQIFPSIESIWTKEAKITEEDLNKLQCLCLAGFKELLDNLDFTKLISSDPKGFATTTLCRVDNMIYFQRYFNFETTILENLQRIKKSLPNLKVDDEKIEKQIQALLDHKVLLQEQADAILKASKQTLTLICGGPGTGKTYTASHLLKVLLEALPENERAQIKIALAAPTGKAASNLQKSLSHLHQNPFEAKTLHRLLGRRSDGTLQSSASVTLNIDILIIDESSMIDVAMMSYLLASIKCGTRVIFLGDPQQLPSVEAGAMFSDMVELNPENKVELKTCLRAELKEIVDFGKFVNKGDSHSVFEMLSCGAALKKIEMQEMTQEALYELVKNRFPVTLKEDAAPMDILKSFDQFKILSPLRKGLFGVDALNHYFFHRLVKKSLKNHPVAVPIMLLRNDPNLELFNGEVGVMVLNPRHEGHFDFSIKKGDFALFPCKTNGVRRFSAFSLPQYEMAFVLSVHKSQGSEFDHVLALLPEGSEHFGREVLYTAVTRARKTLTIFANQHILDQTIKNKTKRLSGLIKRTSKKSYLQ